MAHYAKISDTNLVLNVIVVDDNDELKDGVADEATAVAKLTEMFGWDKWKKCSYNTFGGKHWEDFPADKLSSDQSKALRGNYPGIGFVWDETKNAFYGPQPYSTWTLNETSFVWEAPVAFPSVLTYEKDGVNLDYGIDYDDTNVRWIASDQETPTGNFRWDPSSSSWVSI
jgi:hypothetical protein